MHLISILLLASCSWLAAQEGVDSTRTIFDMASSSLESALGAPKREGDTIQLACNGGKLWDGRQIVFPEACALPAHGNGLLHLEFTIATVDSPAGGWSTRLFLLPGRPAPSRFLDPYGKPDVLAVYIEGSKQDVRISLYVNDRSVSNDAGILLFSGRTTAAAFPLVVDLRCDREIFMLQLGKQVETVSGTRSGRLRLSPDVWNGEVTCGLRLVNLTAGNKPTLHLAQARGAIEPALPVPVSGTQASAATGETLETTVIVHPTTIRATGGFDTVQGLFGGNVNGQSRGQADELLRELRLNTSRLHMWPNIYGAPKDMQAPISPAYAAQFGDGGGWQKPLPADQVQAAWDRWFKLDFDAFLVPLIRKGASEPDSGSMESQLALQKSWGSVSNIVFYTENRMDSNAVRHADDAARYFDRYLTAIKQSAPWLEVAFAELTNEPNYSWWVNSFPDEKSAVDGWITLFNAVDARLKDTHPKTRLLGPCLADCTFFSWGGWKTWTVPALAGVTRDLDDFDYHNYGTSAVSQLAWMSMLQAQAEALGRHRPRAVVTEMNDGWELGKAGNKYEWWAEQLFYGLENPDKYRIFNYFMTAWKCGNGKGEAGNLVSWNGSAFVPTDTYWLFKALRSHRGSIREVEAAGITDLKVIASSPQDDTLTVSLFNNTGRPVRVHLRSGLPAKARITGLTRTSVGRHDGQVRHAEESLPPVVDLDANLPAMGVQSFVWKLESQDLASTGRLTRTEFFSPVVNTVFSSAMSVPVALPRKPREDETVVLRFAVACDDVLSTSGLLLAVNGHAVPVAWADAPREQERSIRSLWLLEVPIPREWMSTTNGIELSGITVEHRLMFLSLVCNQQMAAETVPGIQHR